MKIDIAGIVIAAIVLLLSGCGCTEKEDFAYFETKIEAVDNQDMSEAQKELTRFGDRQRELQGSVR